MGRKKIKIENKKVKISISILPKINNRLDNLSINKSKLINKLLQEYLKSLNL